jgi:hypothetical protein
MKYLKDEVIRTRKGTAVNIPTGEKNAAGEWVLDEDGKPLTEEMTVSKLVYIVLDNYSPTQQFSLTGKEIRHKDKFLDRRDEGAVDEDGWMSFEEEHFDTAKKVVVSLLPSSPAFANFFPQVSDVMDVVTKPKAEEKADEKEEADDDKKKKK